MYRIIKKFQKLFFCFSSLSTIAAAMEGPACPVTDENHLFKMLFRESGNQQPQGLGVFQELNTGEKWKLDEVGLTKEDITQTLDAGRNQEHDIIYLFANLDQLKFSQTLTLSSAFADYAKDIRDQEFHKEKPLLIEHTWTKGRFRLEYNFPGITNNSYLRYKNRLVKKENVENMEKEELNTSKANLIRNALRVGFPALKLQFTLTRKPSELEDEEWVDIGSEPKATDHLSPEEAERKRKEIEALFAENERKIKEIEARVVAKEEAERKRQEEQEAECKRQEEETERQRKEAEEAERQRKEAEEAERQRKAEEAERQRKAEEAERQRKAEEDERQRKAEEDERQRKAEEDERQRQAEEDERQRKAEEDERQRKAEEDERQRKAEEDERQRKAEEDERQRKAEEDERQRKAEEDERQRKAEEDERQHKAEEDERQRKAEEDERQRKAEAEEARLAEEERQRKADEDARRAAEETERKRQQEERQRKEAEEARLAAEEAERQRKAEQDRRAAEEAERQRQTQDAGLQRPTHPAAVTDNPKLNRLLGPVLSWL